MLWLLAYTYKKEFEGPQNRPRSEYCTKFKDMFHGKEEATTFMPGADGKCDVPSYDKAKDDKWALDTLNLIRYAVGFGNTVSVDDYFYENQCKYVGYVRGNNYEWNLYSYYKCYNNNLNVAHLSSEKSTNYPNIANMIYNHVMYDPFSAYSDASFVRYRFLHQNLSHISACGVGKAIAIKVKSMNQYAQESVPFIAWPHPGPVDLQFIPKVWSVYIPSLGEMKSVVVKVGNETVPFKKYPSYGYTWYHRTLKQINGYPAVYFYPDFEAINVTMTKNLNISVTITDASTEFSYTVYTTDCSTDISDEEFDAQWGRVSTKPKKKSKTGLIVGLVILFLVIIAVAAVLVWFFVFRKKDKQSSSSGELKETNSSTTKYSGRTITFESRQEEYSKDGVGVSRKTIIIT